MDIKYAVNRSVSVDQFIELLKETTLCKRRPVENKVRMQGMLDNANLIISAWLDEKLVGIARSVTDFYYCCYLSDLAVSASFQNQGIGKALIRQTFSTLKPGCKIFLLSAPQVNEYYPKIGFTKHNSAWLMSDVNDLN
ncbi:MAG TPA: GNAT family N-acetyltransferase [Balneolales bacterium]|nr:GNAT family N-acetyltransferase [Balneolales bacterium]